MATGSTPIYDFPYPVLSDPVNVHGDIQSLAEQIELVLPSIGLPNHTFEVTNVSGESISKGDPVYITGYSTKPNVAKCDADDLSKFPVIGLAKMNMGNNSDGTVLISGVFEGLDTLSFAAGDVLYVNSGGGLTNTQPITGSGAIGVCVKSDVNGVVIVGQPKGNGTWGSMKAGLA